VLPDRLGPRIEVGELFDEERAALLDLLAVLTPGEWATPSPCPRWTVHGLAVHLVHDDLRRLSAQRDGHTGAWIDVSSFEDLVGGLARTNEAWVAQVAPSLSPRLTCELLAWLAGPTAVHLRSLPPDEEGDDISWAGPGPHPNWLDVAREYTERWVHHQQIRDAVGRPGLTEQRFVEPVLDTFVRALPAHLPVHPAGTEVVVEVTGDVSRGWTLRSTGGGWRFVAGDEGGPATSDGQDPATADDVGPATSVRVDAGALWRRAVRMLGAQEIRDVAQLTGDPALADEVLDLRAAIVSDDGSADRSSGGGSGHGPV
jgi:uncharacterized protein (TIGR03083 family)